MAVDVSTFVASYPEFLEISEDTDAVAVIQRALRDAQRFVGKAAWGSRWEEGVFVKAAALLALTPFGENMRLKGGSSPYEEMYKQMQRSLGVRFGLAGGLD